MKHFIALFIALSIFSCGNDKQHDFTLKGQVKGLKKGKVYLQRQQDSVMVTIDSMDVNGSSSFELHSQLAEPEILFLKLDKNDNDEGTVVFFADKGTTEISSTLKNFNFDAKIKGSKQQETLEEYLVIMSRFNDEHLNLIKNRIEGQMAKDSIGTSFETEYNKLLKRKYLYTINFAVNHADSQVAPYLAISEVSNTSINFLKKIYDALQDDIKTSKYGVELKALIDERQAE
ncbi:MAG: DUF4369 domain-containing protein [Psychroserpens sp.]|uniref:DUF4369 domain-containing protein n=1 Tax=Psychroserpens sp. TaxID=2020870 RepID=UPI003C785BCD